MMVMCFISLVFIILSNVTADDVEKCYKIANIKLSEENNTFLRLHVLPPTLFFSPHPFSLG
jgi:hypothetical protein